MTINANDYPMGLCRSCDTPLTIGEAKKGICKWCPDTLKRNAEGVLVFSNCGKGLFSLGHNNCCKGGVNE